jgi:hypothetical protein
MAGSNTYKYKVTPGVKYAKIARIDQNGTDRSAYLEQLQSFILTYSDVGSVQYFINSIQEQTDCYLFGLQAQPITSSGDTTFAGIIITYTSSFIPNPEFINFEYNDYNPLFGNAEAPQFSSQFLDVDYGAGINTPINFGLILSGTADPAQVQDSNYSSAAWSNIRYNGSRVSSYDFNKPF